MRGRKASVIPRLKQSSGYGSEKSRQIPSAEQNSGYERKKSKFDTQPRAEQRVWEKEKFQKKQK